VKFIIIEMHKKYFIFPYLKEVDLHTVVKNRLEKGRKVKTAFWG
jgi:hypothetical protein